MQLEGGAGRDTPLHVAAQRCLDEHARLYLNHGAHVDARNGRGETALSAACGAARRPDEHARCLRLCALLLRHGAAADARDEDERSPLHKACGRARPSLARLLLRHGADAHALDTASVVFSTTSSFIVSSSDSSVSSSTVSVTSSSSFASSSVLSDSFVVSVSSDFVSVFVVELVLLLFLLVLLLVLLSFLLELLLVLLLFLLVLLSVLLELLLVLLSDFVSSVAFTNFNVLSLGITPNSTSLPIALTYIETFNFGAIELVLNFNSIVSADVSLLFTVWLTLLPLTYIACLLIYCAPLNFIV